MSRYMIQATTTPQAAAGVLQEPEDRTEAIRPIFEAVGGSLERYYVSFAEMTVGLAESMRQLTVRLMTMRKSLRNWSIGVLL